MRNKVVAVGLAVAVAVGMGVLATPASADPSAPVVVVSGLNNPRQIVLLNGNAGPELLIAEAGKGGPTIVGEGMDASYVGFSGSVSAVWNPATTTGSAPQRVVTNLISSSGPDGSFAVGADGVAGRFSGGKIYSVVTYAPPDVPVPPAASAQLGHLLFTTPNKSVLPLQDVSGYEIANNPAGDNIDSNPYSALARKDDILVADAAGNSIIRYGSQGYGAASTFAVLPQIDAPGCEVDHPETGPTINPPDLPGCDFVPTSLAQDKWGNVYVGGLGSLHNGVGRVVKLDPAGRMIKTWTGFTAVTGVAVGDDGSVYVSELSKDTATFAPGAVTKVATDGTMTSVTVPFAAGVAVDKDNNVFVSAFSIAPEGGLDGTPATSGQIWRLTF